MKRILAALAVLVLAIPLGPAQAQPVLRVGFCARTVSASATPFAIATKLGWFAKDGFKVELVPLPGSSDCVKLVATKDLPYALPSIEPVPTLVAQGVPIRNYYTAYQGNIYGIAVPEGSPIKTLADLKGKRIGVNAMASAGYIIARALAVTQGFNPDTDVRIMVAGEGAQAAALVRSNQVDALSQFDTQYALVENAGVKLTYLDTSAISKFPSNGFIALEERLKNNRAEAVALARGYAMGTVYALANPESAVRILWEVYPQTRGTGRDEATAMRDDVHVLNARAKNWKLEAGGVTKWGENSVANYQTYMEFLLANGVIKTKTNAADILDNGLIDDINKFDAAAVIAQAHAAPK